MIIRCLKVLQAQIRHKLEAFFKQQTYYNIEIIQDNNSYKIISQATAN